MAGYLEGEKRIPQTLSWPEVFGILGACEEQLTVAPQGLWTTLGKSPGNTAQKWNIPSWEEAPSRENSDGWSVHV